MVCRDAQTTVLLEVGSSIADRYKQQAQLCAPQFIYKALELANECDLNYRQSKNKRLLVEILLIRLCSITANTDASKKAKPELIKIAVDAAPANSPSTAQMGNPNKPAVAPTTVNTQNVSQMVTEPAATPGALPRRPVVGKLPRRPGSTAIPVSRVTSSTTPLAPQQETKVPQEDKPFRSEERRVGKEC